MSWCEVHDIESVLGLAQNSRLTAAIAPEMAEVTVRDEAMQQAARVFRDFGIEPTSAGPVSGA
jgi:hypothetical protein